MPYGDNEQMDTISIFPPQSGPALLLAGARVRDIEPVPVARPTRELGVGAPSVTFVGVVGAVFATPFTGCCTVDSI